MAEKPLTKSQWRTRLRKKYSAKQVETRYQKYLDSFIPTSDSEDYDESPVSSELDPSIIARFEALKDPSRITKAMRQIVASADGQVGDDTEVIIRRPVFTNKTGRNLLGSSGRKLDVKFIEEARIITGSKPKTDDKEKSA